MDLPAIFDGLVERGKYRIEPETDPIFGRFWRLTCGQCGKVFRPVPTEEAVASMNRHSAVVRKQPVLCRVE